MSLVVENKLFAEFNKSEFTSIEVEEIRERLVTTFNINKSDIVIINTEENRERQIKINFKLKKENGTIK